MSPYVGIVLVSHSVELAAGVADLVAQIGSESVPVAVAGGNDAGGLGTSYRRIREALGAADQGAGVVVVPDLGSAVLTARTVLEDHPRPGAVIADVPFVEGAVAATVAAAGGADLDAVLKSAEEARHVRKF
ncbi:phosphoenolpyruvate--protein phosphotransferase [Streptomyces sp. SID486]|uniref:dihydroxyacetone kinase phosphoryl donor subunit DhaM n=1 Tax=unclassified Streptomyces TaxID=2593676 RepID=UPI00136F454F|nr:dihydroxyacetone kinase phosphoryl donor subunit DhaM [Streptomyces sp. SID486]MYW15030.1 phosphoenolpyruvate--protein phosphotransferase [Streptomyces sp. SID2955]MYX99476.1 phosphoenolpyruvate--protein phosphotransferase [Streptomyces sp. SID486]